MNKRIHEAIQRANKYVIFLSNNTESKHQIAMQRLAEEIISECIHICNEMYFEDFPDADRDFERCDRGDAIAEHFGFGGK